MNFSPGSDTDRKTWAMHKMAYSLYNSGDYGAALKIWKHVKTIQPHFDAADHLIGLASRKIHGDTDTPDPEKSSVFRTQRDIIAQRRLGSRNRVFHPRASYIGLEKRIRHRHLVLIFMIFLMVFLYLSVRNNRAYMILLNPVTNKLDCYQGNFFPLGWERTMEIEIGIEHNWVMYVENREIIRKLHRGVVVKSLESFNDQVIEIFMTLGDESFRQMTERGQQSAVYYYRRVLDAGFEDRVIDKMVKAFINLARIKIVSRDFRNARKHLDSAREFGYPDIEITTVQRELEDAQRGQSHLL